MTLNGHMPPHRHARKPAPGWWAFVLLLAGLFVLLFCCSCIAPIHAQHDGDNAAVKVQAQEVAAVKAGQDVAALKAELAATVQAEVTALRQEVRQASNQTAQAGRDVEQSIRNKVGMGDWPLVLLMSGQGILGVLQWILHSRQTARTEAAICRYKECHA